MKKVLVYALVATSLILSSCGILDIGSESLENGSAKTVILLGKDESVGRLPADRASISEVELLGPELTLEVTYSGGCKEHEFGLYATRSFVETNPPGAEVYLAHDANGDACRALISDELTFDLLPLEQLFQKQYSGNHAFIVNLHEPTGDDPRFEHIEQESPPYEILTAVLMPRCTSEQDYAEKKRAFNGRSPIAMRIRFAILRYDRRKRAHATRRFAVR